MSRSALPVIPSFYFSTSRPPGSIHPLVATWQMVKNLQDLGKTVFLTTHYMDEAEHLADRVAVIVGGEIVAEGAPRELAGRAVAGTAVSFMLPPGAPSLPPELGGSFTASNATMSCQTKQPARLLHDLTAWALDHDVELIALNVSQPTLEDVFLELTGGEVSTGSEEGSTEQSNRRRRRAGR